MSTARDFSVMPVQVWNADGTPADTTPIERAVRRLGQSLHVGTHCDVEFGATWATERDTSRRIDGQWYQCLILRHQGATLHVRLSPAPGAGPPAFG